MNLQVEHQPYKESLFTNRFIKHSHLKSKITEIQSKGVFKVTHVGNSVQHQEIYHLTIGTGPISVLLWSQMHGNEPTGTLAFFDLFNFFAGDDEHNFVRKQILANCTLHFIPMLNPDGAAAYQRRNAQGIDINRDFSKRQTPEANILIDLQQSIKPEFCFNMHDQENLWSVTGSKKPAAISLLAPPADQEASLTHGRFKAMLVIAGIYEDLEKQIPGSIGRWSEEYEPRAFGDNFQRLGSSTILIESGGFDQDFEKQYVRKLNFDILLQALMQISTGGYSAQPISRYYSISPNNKELFHLLIKNCVIYVEGSRILADIGLNYSEVIDAENGQHVKTYEVADLGDLSTWNAYDVVDAGDVTIDTTVQLGIKPTLSVTDKGGRVFKFINGVIS